MWLPKGVSYGLVSFYLLIVLGFPISLLIIWLNESKTTPANQACPVLGNIATKLTAEKLMLRRWNWGYGNDEYDARVKHACPLNYNHIGDVEVKGTLAAKGNYISDTNLILRDCHNVDTLYSLEFNGPNMVIKTNTSIAKAKASSIKSFASDPIDIVTFTEGYTIARLDPTQRNVQGSIVYEWVWKITINATYRYHSAADLRLLLFIIGSSSFAFGGGIDACNGYFLFGGISLAIVVGLSVLAGALLLIRKFKLGPFKDKIKGLDVPNVDNYNYLNNTLSSRSVIPQFFNRSPNPSVIPTNVSPPITLYQQDYKSFQPIPTFHVQGDNSPEINSPLIPPPMQNNNLIQPPPFPQTHSGISEGGWNWQQGEKILGKGARGICYQGIDKYSGRMCCLKVISGFGTDPYTARETENEVRLLQNLRHENIVDFYDCKIDSKSSCMLIAMEYVAGGSLLTVLYSFKLDLVTVRKFLVDILRGLYYLHANNVIHRDIKPANILLSTEGSCKLTDFGTAKYTLEATAAMIASSAAAGTFCGTPNYMAPEQVSNQADKASDIWAVGMTAIEMVTQQRPWSQLDSKQPFAVMFAIRNGDEHPIPDRLGPMGKDFVTSCLTYEPKSRPPAGMLLNHPFLNYYDTSPTFSGMEENKLLQQQQQQQQQQQNPQPQLLMTQNDWGTTF